MEEGLGYSVNVPLHEGIDDQMYSTLFTRVGIMWVGKRGRQLHRCTGMRHNPSEAAPKLIGVRLRAQMAPFAGNG